MLSSVITNIYISINMNDIYRLSVFGRALSTDRDAIGENDRDSIRVRHTRKDHQCFFSDPQLG